MGFGAFLGGAAAQGSKEISDQDDRAFKLKLQNAQIEGQIKAQTRQQEEAARLAQVDEGTSKKLREWAGISPKEGPMNAQSASTALGMGKAMHQPTGSGRNSVTMSGKMIMDNVPKGKELGLDENTMYPMAVANFLRAATKDNMGTAEMRNQVVGILTFQESLDALEAKYKQFDPSNPASKTASQMWAGLTKGYSFTGKKSAAGAAQELKDEVLRSADNADVADMLLSKIQVALDLTKATSGGHASDLDLKLNMQVVPDYTGDVKLQGLRFQSLRDRSNTKMSVIGKAAPKIVEKPEEVIVADAEAEKRKKRLAAARAYQQQINPPKVANE